jgi:hypothetical protein
MNVFSSVLMERSYERAQNRSNSLTLFPWLGAWEKEKKTISQNSEKIRVLKTSKKNYESWLCTFCILPQAYMQMVENKKNEY